MKSQSLLAALAVTAVFSTQASAAKVDTCVNELSQHCGRVLPWSFLASLNNAESCKIVEQQGVRNIAIIASAGKQLTSVSALDCRASQYTFQSGEITDTGILNGRLYATLSSGRVAIVGKNNTIYELNNFKRKPYSDVESVTIAEDGIILNRVRNQRTGLTNEQLQNRIDENKLTSLAEPK